MMFVPSNLKYIFWLYLNFVPNIEIVVKIYCINSIPQKFHMKIINYNGSYIYP